MRFPLVIRRYLGTPIAGAKLLGGDTDPTTYANGPPSQAHIGDDNVLAGFTTDTLTNVSNRILLSLSGPGNTALANPLVITAFVYDQNLQMWINLANGGGFGRQGSTINLQHKQISWVNLPSLNDRPGQKDTNTAGPQVTGSAGQRSPSQTNYVMINASNPGGLTNGEYDILVGLDLSSVP